MLQGKNNRHSWRERGKSWKQPSDQFPCSTRLFVGTRNMLDIFLFWKSCHIHDVGARQPSKRPVPKYSSTITNRSRKISGQNVPKLLNYWKMKFIFDKIEIRQKILWNLKNTYNAWDTIMVSDRKNGNCLCLIFMHVRDLNFPQAYQLKIHKPNNNSCLHNSSFYAISNV